jgi:hypothetical protein
MAVIFGAACYAAMIQWPFFLSRCNGLREGALRRGAQDAAPIAIAMAEMTAAERNFRAEVKLKIDAAMVRAIGAGCQ